MAEASPEKVYDLYAPILNYKLEITALNHPFRSISWLPAEHKRRLQAYEVLSAFYHNSSRDYRFSPESGDTSQNDSLRELGDAAWLCDKIKSKLLGDGIALSIPAMARVNKSLAAASTPELEAKAALLSERLLYLQDWWDDSDAYLAIDQNEEKCSYLGDCVYLLHWNPRDAAPEVATYDPGFVFPSWGSPGASVQGGVEASVVDRVIVAWEEAGESDTTTRIWRDIYELREIGTERQCWRHYGYYDLRIGSESQLSTLREEDLVAGSSAGWQYIGLDFLPFVWVQNSQEQGEDYGKSNLHNLIDLLDLLITADTDLSKNAEKLGGVIVALSGSKMQFRRDATTNEPLSVEVMPNTVYNLGENGRMDVMDTSSMQTALLDTLTRIDKRLIRNSCITEVGAGLVDTQTELSGIALSMLLQPLTDKLKPMRKLRQKRYTMLFYYVQRLWATFGSSEEKVLFGGDLYDVTMNFGSVVPQDDNAKIDYYLKLMTILDEETVLQMMVDDGFDIDIQTVLSRKAADREKAQAESLAAFGMNREADTTDDQGGAQE